jgi:hypothetical protein
VCVFINVKILLSAYIITWFTRFYIFYHLSFICTIHILPSSALVDIFVSQFLLKELHLFSLFALKFLLIVLIIEKLDDSLRNKPKLVAMSHC